MKLLLLNVKGHEKVTMGLLRDAARELQIPVLEIDPEYPLPHLDPRERYLLYRVCIHSHQKELALYRRYYVTSHAGNYMGLRGSVMERFHAAGVPVPAFTFAKSTERQHLAEKVEAVGGFPIVIKAPQKRGGNGIGIIKVDALDTLVSLAPLLLDGESSFRIMRYIDHRRGGRLIVVGDHVVSSHEVARHHLDFRTNREDRNPSRKRFDYPESVNQIAVRATHANGYTFGGVDIMFSEAGEPFLTEVNFPCFFATTEQTTGFPVAKTMIAFLAERCGEREHKFDHPWPSPLPPPAYEAPADSEGDLFAADLLSGGPTDTTMAIEALTETPPVLILLAGEKEQTAVVASLRKAAANFGLETVRIDPEDELPQLPQGEKRLLYRVCRGHREREVELCGQLRCIDLAQGYPVLAADDYDREECFETAELPFVVKMAVRGKDIRYLKAQTEHVGGFPLLLTLDRDGAPHPILVDSFDSFVGIVDFARFLGHRLEIRSRAELDRFGRLVVLDGRVIAAVEFLIRERPCYGVDPAREVAISCRFDNDIEALAVAAAKSHGLAFAAVDIQVAAGSTAIDDVHFPFDIDAIETITSVPIAEALIETMLDELMATLPPARKDGELKLAFE